MKKKISALIAPLCLFLITSCFLTPTPEPNSTDPFGADQVNTMRENDENPVIADKASASQDFIFSTESVGITTVTIRRSEWNKMLSYYDYFYKNENLVYADSYEYEKDGTTWKLNAVGMRLRGNTSRFRPQGKDTPTDETGHTMPNAEWSQSYYEYAASCPDTDYRQSHFKIDFEPFDSDDRKMSECMKGVALKRSDSVFSREIFCYDLFHQYGIWTAPRASQTKVYIKFIEDVNSNGKVNSDISSCTTTTVDFGVYEMFEEVNKQSLKGRNKKNNDAKNAWKNNSGDLWKCSGGNLTAASNISTNFGVEQVEILNTDKPKSNWSYVWHSPCYDLKTNKSDLTRAAAYFQGFITELNNLSDTSYLTEEGISARKAFYEKWFDVDFFIRTYAVNILVGMDDDYWGNANNYYLYFDNAEKGTNKCYLIPFDYDNTLGYSISGDKVRTNPFEWGKGSDRPLLDRLLEVPEYAGKFKAALLDVSSQEADSPWNKDRCIETWNKWHAQVAPYVASPDLPSSPNISYTAIDDNGGWKEQKHYLTKETDNIYQQTSANIRLWVSDEDVVITFDLNGGSINGSTANVTGVYTGVTSKFSAMVMEPVYEGHVFLGWTKTLDGSDYISSYSGEDNLKVYASWADVSAFTDLAIFEVPDSTFSGIKIGIVNIPENNYRRTVYINGKEVGGDSKENPQKYTSVWAYPFTEPGKDYEVFVSYSNEEYGYLGSSNHITITAQSGLGEFKLLNTPEFYIENNLLKWKTEPVIQIGNSNSIREDSNWDEYFLLEVQSTKPSWKYQSWNYMGASCNTNFNFMDHVDEEVKAGTYSDLCFRLRYIYNTLSYGDFYLIIHDYNDGDKFNLVQ